MKPLLHQRPVDLERRRGRHLQLAVLADDAGFAEVAGVHMNLAAFYREQIAAIIRLGDGT